MHCCFFGAGKDFKRPSGGRSKHTPLVYAQLRAVYASFAGPLDLSLLGTYSDAFCASEYVASAAQLPRPNMCKPTCCCTFSPRNPRPCAGRGRRLCSTTVEIGSAFRVPSGTRRRGRIASSQRPRANARTKGSSGDPFIPVERAFRHETDNLPRVIHLRARSKITGQHYLCLR